MCVEYDDGVCVGVCMGGWVCVHGCVCLLAHVSAFVYQTIKKPASFPFPLNFLDTRKIVCVCVREREKETGHLGGKSGVFPALQILLPGTCHK